MENEIEKKDNTEDEISLLDLFAVLIRYRKLVIIGTSIVTLLAVIWLFLMPVFFKKTNHQTADVTYTVDVRNVPLSISVKLPNNETITPLYLATYNTQRLPFLVDQIKANNIFSDNEMSSYEFNSFVQSLIKDGKIKVEESPLGTGYDINLKVSIEKIDDATKLVRSIVEDTEKSVQNYYNPLIQTLAQNTKKSLEKATSTATTDAASLQALQDLSVELEEFSQNFGGFLSLRAEPFVVPEGRGRIKKLIIIVFAALFVFVFAAFCKNAIANIKADPESNKLIADAWKAGK